jgi:hypothetical protein
MTEYRTQAEGPPPAEQPTVRLGTIGNPLPFRIVKRCAICGERGGRFAKEAVHSKAVLRYVHRGDGNADGCGGEWFTHTAPIEPAIVMCTIAIATIGMVFGLLCFGEL